MTGAMPISRNKRQHLPGRSVLCLDNEVNDMLSSWKSQLQHVVFLNAWACQLDKITIFQVLAVVWMIKQATRVLIICTDVRPLLQSPYVGGFCYF